MRIPFKISSIFGGLSVCDYFNLAGQFQASSGIDPDMPATDAGDKPCGYIRPTKMAKFSGSNVNATPLFILTNPKISTIHVVLSNGRVISYDSSLANEALVDTITGSVAKGAEYYDNYHYIATGTLIGRLGPLNGTVALTDDYWNGVLTKTALTNTTYPSINGVAIPNHNMHRHTDNKLYICDVLSTNKGCLHYIKTTKTTVEGDTNDGSTENALDFGYGEYPVCIETYQTDLVVGLIEGVNTAVKQKPAKISFWDTSADSFTSITSIELSDPLVTAIKNVNGIPYVFSGYATGGCRVSKLVSGYSLEEVVWLPEQFLPISPSAVDHILNRFVFGSNTVEPEVAGVGFSIGAKEKNLPMGLHVPVKSTATGGNPMVTAVKYVEVNGKIVQPVIGWKDDVGYGLDKITTGGGNSRIRLEVVVPEYEGRTLRLKMLKFPFIQAMAANMSFTVTLYADNAENSKTFTISNTAGVSGKRSAIIYPEIDFENNFFLEINTTGSVLLTLALPISGMLETSNS